MFLAGISGKQFRSSAMAVRGCNASPENHLLSCFPQVHDLRLNENKLKAVLFTSMFRFTNLTDLNLTKNEISYIEDGAFAGQANLQVCSQKHKSYFIYLFIYLTFRDKVCPIAKGEFIFPSLTFSYVTIPIHCLTKQVSGILFFYLQIYYETNPK